MKKAPTPIAKTAEDTTAFLKQAPSAKNTFQWMIDTTREHYTRSKCVMNWKSIHGVEKKGQNKTLSCFWQERS